MIVWCRIVSIVSVCRLSSCVWIERDVLTVGVAGALLWFAKVGFGTCKQILLNLVSVKKEVLIVKQSWFFVRSAAIVNIFNY